MRYKSPAQALAASFKIVSKSGIKTPAYGGMSPTDYSHLSLNDRVTHAVYIIHCAYRNLMERERYIILANYSQIPEEKEPACMYLANNFLQDKIEGSVDRRYTAEIVRDWAGAKRQKTDVQWAREINKHPTTLSIWRIGKKSAYRKGGAQILDGWHSKAMAELWSPFREAGYITDE